MKRILTVFIACFAVLSLHAQHHLAFQKLYSTTGPSNQGNSIIAQPNGDFIVSCIRSVPMSGGQYIANILLLRINGTGDTLWTKEIGTATERELVYNMIQLPNNNLVITGSINIPPVGMSDALIVYADINGDVIWQKQIGGSNGDFATDAAFDGQNLIICGATESYGAGAEDVWLIKMNLSGDTLWTKTFGGMQTDDAWSIIVAHNQYIFTGGTYSYANGQYDDAWLVKTDTSGNEIFRKTYGVQDRVDWAWSVIPTETNGVIDGYAFTGIKDTEENAPGNGNGALHFVKTDTAGNVVWDKSIQGSPTPWRREGFDLIQTTDGGYVICGYKLEPSVQSQQLYVVRTDAGGNVIWDTAYGTSDSSYYTNSMVATNNGGWVITGSVFHPNPSQQIRYIFVARFDPGGAAVHSIEYADEVALYPNPVTGDRLFIKGMENSKIQSVRITSIDGRIIKEYNQGNLSTIDLSGISTTGMLLVDIITDEGVTRKKVLKTK